MLLFFENREVTPEKHSWNQFQNYFFMLMNDSQSKSTSYNKMFLSNGVDTNIVKVNFIVIILGVNKRTKN